MRYRRSRSYFFPVALVVAVCLAVLNISAVTNGKSSLFGSMVGAVARPVSAAFGTARDALAEIPVYFASKQDLQEQNRLLAEQCAALKRQNDSLETLLQENRFLYRFLGLRYRHTDYTMIPARTLASSVQPLTQLTVNTGSYDGVTAGMSAVTQDMTFVGQVVEVGAFHARIVTLLSADVAAAVYCERTKTPYTVTGRFDYQKSGHCVIEGLAGTADIQIGDRLYTSGVSGLIPPDLYVGTVVELVPDSAAYTVSAVIDPELPTEPDRLMLIEAFTQSYDE